MKAGEIKKPLKFTAFDIQEIIAEAIGNCFSPGKLDESIVDNAFPEITLHLTNDQVFNIQITKVR